MIAASIECYATWPWPIFYWSVFCFLFGMVCYAALLTFRLHLIIKRAEKQLKNDANDDPAR